MELRSVGILYCLQDVFKFFEKYQLTTTSINRAPRMFGAGTEYAVRFAKYYGWLAETERNELQPTELGYRVHQGDSRSAILRAQLHHYIEMDKPPWAYLFASGRKEVVAEAPSFVSQILKDAGLLELESHYVVAWWDAISALVRGEKQAAQVALGRRGERLSLDYEEQRVRKRPLWQGLGSNAAGYDLLSAISSSDYRALCIEVKTTTRPVSQASIFLTRNEWSVATTMPNYCIHVWHIGQNSSLWVLPMETLEPHIPKNRGEGIWENSRLTITGMLAGRRPQYVTG